MLDFDRLWEGFSITGKVTAKPSAKVTAKASARSGKKPTAKSPFSIPKITPPKPKPVSVMARAIATRTAAPSPFTSKPKPAQPAAPRPAAFSIAAKIAAPKITVPKVTAPKVSATVVAKPAVRFTPFKPTATKKVMPAITQLSTKPVAKIAPKLQAAIQTHTAANIISKPLQNLARKAPVLPKIVTPEIQQKAVAAVTPVAKACKCKAQPVVKTLDKSFAKKGYPDHTATSLLAGLHDMSAHLEKAAVQRLATHEHKTLSKKHAFEHKVLEQLGRIARCLPPCHPARTKAHLTILRRA